MPYTISDDLQKDLQEFLASGRSSQGNKLLGRLTTECEGQYQRPGPKKYPAVEINGEWFEYSNAEYEHLHHAQAVHVLVPAERTPSALREWSVNSRLSTVTIKPSKTARGYHFYGAQVVGMDAQPGAVTSVLIIRFDADQPYRGSL